MGDEPLQVDCVGAGQLGEEARQVLIPTSVIDRLEYRYDRKVDRGLAAS